MRHLLRSVIAVSALLYPPWASADMISLQPDTQESVVGSAVFLDVIASDLNLGAFDLTVSFDPALLSPTAIVFDTFLGAPLSTQLSSVGYDSLNLSETSWLATDALIAQQPASFRLARLEFDALDVGVSTISFSDATVVAPDASILTPQLASASLTIKTAGGGTEPVPEPSGGLMCATGLLALGSITIWRRKG